VLHADFMPRSHNPALEQAESRFHRVGRDTHTLFVAYIFLGMVVYCLVLAAILRRIEVVDSRLIGHDNVHGLVHVASNDVVDGLVVHLVRVNEVQMTAAFSNADHRSFIAPPLGALGFSADVHLINFDCSSEFVVGLGHRSPNPVTEIPRGFVADSERAFDLIRRHPFAAFAKQVGAEKPLPQIQMGIVEDRCGSDRELVMA